MDIERFHQIIQEQLGTNGPLTDETKLVSDLGGDSLDFLELIVTLEDDLRVEISDDEWEAMGTDPTVGQVRELLERRGA
jgi:acyl carrier protein